MLLAYDFKGPREENPLSAGQKLSEVLLHCAISTTLHYTWALKFLKY